MVKKDLSNKKFGKLLAIKEVGKHKNGNYLWECLCDCGKTVIKQTKDVSRRKSCSYGCGSRKDLSNKKFGKLLVIKHIGTHKKSGNCLWECLCDCGKTVIRQSNSITKASSCGCGLRKDLSNKKFGKLLAIKEIGKHKDGGYLWECLCDCGKTVIRKTRSICRSSSCGCASRENRLHKRIDTQTRALNHLYSSYKIRGTQIYNGFELTKKDFVILIKNNCFYCGSPPKERTVCYRNKYIPKHLLPIGEKQRRLAKNGEPITLICNGIDRLNSALGYFLDNVVSCCTICNRMKLDLGVEEFSNQVEKIYKNLNLKNINFPQNTSDTPALSETLSSPISLTNTLVLHKCFKLIL
jgi:hypothetical protein